MAGYSGTPLVKKLGIKDAHRVALLDAPPHFAASIAPLPDGVVTATKLVGKLPLDVVIAFVTERTVLERRIVEVRPRLSPAGGFWIAWPKRASKVPTDVTEDVVRVVALPTGLVDNKVCAIDDVWSGLRLVIRRELRMPATVLR